MKNTTNTRIQLLLSLAAAFIMVQSLFFKFSGAAESIYIFSTLGLEPYGRIGTGVGELLASILLFTSWRWAGALLGIGLMSGAIFFHLTTLGIEVMDDKGQLFIYALITFVSCCIILILDKNKVIAFIQNIIRTS